MKNFPVYFFLIINRQEIWVYSRRLTISFDSFLKALNFKYKIYREVFYRYVNKNLFYLLKDFILLNMIKGEEAFFLLELLHEQIRNLKGLIVLLNDKLGGWSRCRNNSNLTLVYFYNSNKIIFLHYLQK